MNAEKTNLLQTSAPIASLRFCLVGGSTSAKLADATIFKPALGSATLQFRCIVQT